MLVSHPFTVFLLTIPILVGSDDKLWTDPHDMGIKATDVKDIVKTEPKDVACSASDLTKKFLHRHVQRLMSVLDANHPHRIKAMLSLEFSTSDVSHLNTFLHCEEYFRKI